MVVGACDRRRRQRWRRQLTYDSLQPDWARRVLDRARSDAPTLTVPKVALLRAAPRRRIGAAKTRSHRSGARRRKNGPLFDEISALRGIAPDGTTFA
jgi:hypothetical protein